VPTCASMTAPRSKKCGAPLSPVTARNGPSIDNSSSRNFGQTSIIFE